VNINEQDSNFFLLVSLTFDIHRGSERGIEKKLKKLWFSCVDREMRNEIFASYCTILKSDPRTNTMDDDRRRNLLRDVHNIAMTMED
jgi:hypothetical protein